MGDAEDPIKLKQIIKRIFGLFEFQPDLSFECEDPEAIVEKLDHLKYLTAGFDKLPPWMRGVDSGQPWFIYWLTNALEILNVKGYELTPEQKKSCCAFLRQCWNEKEGGFAGAPFL